MPAITFSGIASGLDSDGIIKALLDARRIGSTPMKAQITSKENENKALEELSTKLLSLQDALKEFMTLSGNTVSKAATSSNPESLGVSVSGNALTGSSSISVKQLARAATLSFADRFSSPDSAIAPNLAEAVTMQLTLGSGGSTKQFSITVDRETTLSQIARKISEESGEEILASIVNMGTESSPSYALLIRGTKLGSEAGSLSVTVPNELQSQGVFSSSTLQQAQDAIVNIQGLGDVTRPSNSISDVLPGLTLELKGESSAPVSISVLNDVEKTTVKFEKVIGLLNEIIKFGKDNDKIERVEDSNNQATNVFGSLAKTSVDNQLLGTLKNAVMGTRVGEEGTVKIFADLGVTTNRDGTYNFDPKTFKEALTKEPEAATGLLTQFGDKLASINGIINTFTGFQGTFDRAIASNDSTISRINERLSRLEYSLTQQEASLKQTFAKLESKIGQLNSGADALSSMLGSLSTTNRK